MEIENQVVWLVVQGSRNSHTELRALESNGTLGDLPELIRRQHRQQVSDRAGRTVAC
jgi:hypothetical protein